MRYPSWRGLAEQGAALAKAKKWSKTDEEATQGLFRADDYPEVFQRAVARLGGVEPLLAGLRPNFRGQQTTGRAYEFLARWPFRCYLTTNYDDELTNHLRRVGEHFTTVGNSKADLAQITGESARLVVKLHGDLKSPNDIVLTTSGARGSRWSQHD